MGMFQDINSAKIKLVWHLSTVMSAHKYNKEYSQGYDFPEHLGWCQEAKPILSFVTFLYAVQWGKILYSVMIDNHVLLIPGGLLIT
jgi:hypothetical protein